MKVKILLMALIISLGGIYAQENVGPLQQVENTLEKIVSITSKCDSCDKQEKEYFELFMWHSTLIDSGKCDTNEIDSLKFVVAKLAYDLIPIYLDQAYEEINNWCGKYKKPLDSIYLRYLLKIDEINLRHLDSCESFKARKREKIQAEINDFFESENNKMKMIHRSGIIHIENCKGSLKTEMVGDEEKIIFERIVPEKPELSLVEKVFELYGSKRNSFKDYWGKDVSDKKRLFEKTLNNCINFGEGL
jgi:hypothetical protein